MSNTYLVLDIETIPDPTLWSPSGEEIEIPKIEIDKNPAKASLVFLERVVGEIQGLVVLGRDPKKEVHPEDIEKAFDIAKRAKRFEDMTKLDPFRTVEKKQEEFAPIQAQIPIAIGCVWLDSELHPKKVGCMKNEGGVAGERKLIMEWNDFMAKELPTIVTWYGRGFDLPVLMLRSFRHGANMKWYFDDKDYRYRYTESRHADLCDVMADFGAVRSLKLDFIAKVIGLPGKHGDVDGSKVKEMYEQGKIDQICTYCTDDTLQTAFVFLRWRLIKGRMSLESYRKAVLALLGVVSEMENLAPMRKLISDSVLLLENQ